MRYLIFGAMIFLNDTSFAQTAGNMVGRMKTFFKEYVVTVKRTNYLSKENLKSVTFRKKGSSFIMVEYIIIPNKLVDSLFISQCREFNLKQSCSYISDGEAIDFRSFSYKEETFVLHPCNYCSGTFSLGCKPFKDKLSGFLSRSRIAYLDW
jgi:hypothetical protein